MKKRRIYIATIAISIIAIMLIVLMIVVSKPHVNASNPGFRKYITAYTSGMISKESGIKIRLLSDIAKTIDKDKKLPEKLIKLSPKVDGTFFWSDENTIEFKPKEELPSNKEYIVEFELNKLTKVPTDLKSFVCKFKTIKQNFEVAINEIKTIDKKDFKFQNIYGILKTADKEKEENVSKVVKAYLDGKEVKIKWNSNGNRDHFFEIDSAKRESSVGELELKYDGSALNASNSGSIKIEIPGLNDFKLLSHRVLHQPEQCLQLQFSDPIDDTQDLSGFITIKNVNDLRYIVEENIIRVYPPNRLNGNYEIALNGGIKNLKSKKLNTSNTISANFEELLPSVRFVGKGVILPKSKDGLVVPFEAVNLNAVDVRIIKIFESNVTQFLQINDYEGESELKRVGIPVVKKTIRLDQSNVIDFSKWNRYSLDMNELISQEPGAIYRVYLSFKKQYSLWSCDNTDESETNMKENEESWDPEEQDESSFWDNYENSYYDYDNYWNNKDNPCNDAYYTSDKMVSKNIISSNIGMISKKSDDGSLNIFVSDIVSTKPMAGVSVEILNYQNQLLQSASTSSDGVVAFKGLKNPYFIVAKKDKEKGYLKISDGHSLTLSPFQVQGSSVKKGLKGFIFGERGVWRPGDSLFITFILQESENKLPENHPIVFELKNSRDQIVSKLIQQKNASGFYAFKTKTDDNAQTGDYVASVTVGGVSFYKNMKIETIKPNRLKIDLKFPNKYIAKGKEVKAAMNVRWLHGAIAKNLNSKVEVKLSQGVTSFERFKDYSFDDVTKYFYSESQTILDDQLDDEGNVKFDVKLENLSAAPGILNAVFFTRVFEKSSDFSIDQFSIPYYPYESFVGIKLPKGDKERGMLLTDVDHNVDLVVVDPSGAQISATHSVDVEFYKLEWRWWWDKTEETFVNYSSSTYNTPIDRDTIRISGKGNWKIKINYPEWGRYLVKATDLNTGHSSSKIVYIDWPGWAGRAQSDMGGGASLLSFAAEKEKYNIGEEIKITVPTSENGRVLFSIENGSSVLSSQWVDSKKGQTAYSFKATEKMAPNIYISATYLQQHSQSANDLPIRMFGVIPVSVENPKTHLNPVISMPDVIEPEQTVNITVSEKNNREMNYTIAIVDEGLLGLTRFKTPQPWEEFYAKEALGIKTWDIYDWVVGAFAGEMDRVLSIGGDASLNKEGGKKTNRFKPVVTYLGPFNLKGGTKVHSVKIPRYIGEVRTMVIAGNNGAYGNAEKSTQVRKPLMVLATLPRVISPGEELKLPVTVFAMQAGIKNATVQVKTNGLLKISNSSSLSVNFKSPGEQYCEFDLKVDNAIGKAKVEVIVTSGSHTSSDVIEIEVRSPNPPITNVVSDIIEANGSKDLEYKLAGLNGTNKITLEVSSVPPLNLDKRLNYLIQYPYGCIEQTTSAVFPQLFVESLLNLSKDKKSQIESNIKAGITKISKFQLASGGLGYWPGAQDADEWATNYAGHFMIEAEKKGYAIPSTFMSKWVKYQKKMAQNYSVSNQNRSDLIQAYRLYTLALADQPEKGAMNRLRESEKLESDVKWRLAAAYQIIGKTDIAESMVQNLSVNVPVYAELGLTYGSDTRDKALILETLTLLGQKKKAFDLLKEISNGLSSNAWYSTQSTAYALLAISKYIGQNITNPQTKYTYQVKGASAISINEVKPVTQVTLPVNFQGNQTVSLKNATAGTLFVRIITEGVPMADSVEDAENGLRMMVSYKYMNGNSLDNLNIEQGTDFIAEVTVTNPESNLDYKQLVINQMFPSGWEIINTRMQGGFTWSNVSIPTYQDIRDDRAYIFFDLPKNQTKTFRILLNAAYVGKYYLPTVTCEAMYDASINARQKGKWIEVLGQEGI